MGGWHGLVREKDRIFDYAGPMNKFFWTTADIGEHLKEK